MELKAAKCIVLVISFSVLFQITASLTAEQEVEIERIVKEDFMTPNQIPGVGLTIVQENESSYLATGYGLMDVENGVNASGQTQFGIASVSKVDNYSKKLNDIKRKLLSD
jgi:CubicO group peptidase (beta-lactamase class C family)